MPTGDYYETLIDELIKVAGDNDRIEVEERSVLELLEKLLGSNIKALEEWEIISHELRKRVVRNDYVVQWDMFRRAIRLSKLPTIEELESACELYQNATPREIERIIRNLDGIEFETFLVSILGRLPEFREITTTRQSHDEGIDLKGIYVPASNSPHFVLRGQAKQVQNAVTSSQARDFIGALNITNERGLVGLFVSTGGFTEPAKDALDKCSVRIMQWDMQKLIAHSQELTTRKIELSFGVPDSTFWDEVLGRA